MTRKTRCKISFLANEPRLRPGFFIAVRSFAAVRRHRFCVLQWLSERCSVGLRFHPSGSSLIWSTYLGGTSIDQASALALDSAGDVYITGDTYSFGLGTVGAFQPANAGPSRAFSIRIPDYGPKKFFVRVRRSTFWAAVP